MVVLGNQTFEMGFYARKLHETYARFLLEKYDLRFIELEILALLAQPGGEDCAKELMQELHISKSIDRLTRRGLVYGVEDANDHRVHHMHLTEKGMKVANAFIGIQERCEGIMFRGVSQQEIVAIRQVARQMISNTIDALKSLHPDQKAMR